MDIALSPAFTAFKNHHPVKFTCDCGATAVVVHLDTAVRTGMNILPTKHLARQADGVAHLRPCGEVHESFTFGPVTIRISAVVCENLSSEVLLGEPALISNRMCIDHAERKIHFKDASGSVLYTHSFFTDPSKRTRDPSARSVEVVRSPANCVLFPGDFLEVKVNSSDFDLSSDEICIEPRVDSPHPMFPAPMVTQHASGTVRIPNLSDFPVSVKRHQHLAQIRSVCSPDDIVFTQEDRGKPSSAPLKGLHSAEVLVDPDGLLSSEDRIEFLSLHEKYDSVFDPSISKYNDASGKIRAHVNIGSVAPPKSKAVLPSYCRSNMSDLQSHMDDLEKIGVLAKPEDVGVVVEHVSPSFLVPKPSGGERCVTSFVGLASFTKPPPSKATRCEDVMRFLARFKFVIKSDMTNQFYQLPVTRASMKYLGTMTPFKGLRVYTRAAMGMPGSTEQLDELMSRVLGDLLHEGVVMKIADDLYVGGDNIIELLYNWERTLVCFHKNDLRLKARKTVICPRSTVVLGWIWCAGSLSVSPHKLNPLVSAEPPKTVKGLRSWMGAYKHIKACIPKFSSLLSPLEAAVAGRDSAARIDWSADLLGHFKSAQAGLSSPKTISTPKPSDRLVITHDGAVKNAGVGSVLFLVRDGVTRLGGYFSAKLNKHQQRWLPCEIEGLAISAATQHWAPYIMESNHQTQILTDSKPCVQAFQRLQKGLFSNSARVSSFLSALGRYDVVVKHISSDKNLPADYLSRNPSSCSGGDNCQICKFVSDSELDVRQLSVSDVLSGKAPMPYLSLATWRQSQHDCPKLRRVFSHLQQGTSPSKKTPSLRDIKAYLRQVVIGQQGTLVVKSIVPFMPAKNLIVVPEELLHGLLTALHFQLSHPSYSQLQKVFNRHFFCPQVG